MQINKSKANCSGIKIIILDDDDNKVGRAFLYFMHNDLHERPFGLMEDVFVREESRGQGFGTALVEQVIKAAKQNNCYKLIATSRYSRPRVHRLYEKLGFRDYGKEFRIDF